MNVRISRCYYHVEKPAVAVCAQCGADICRECAVKDDFGRIICCECGNNNLKQEHKKYREALKQQGGRFRDGKEFVIPGIIGILINIVICLIAYNENFLVSGNGVMMDILVMIPVMYVFFSIPFCMIMLNDRFAPRYDTWYNHFSGWYWKIVISFLVGWIVFTFYLIRYIIIKIKSKK